MSEGAARGGPGAREGRAARAKRRMERQGKVSSLTAEQAPAEPSDIETICEGFGIRERAGQASAGPGGCSPSRREAARLLAGPGQSSKKKATATEIPQIPPQIPLPAGEKAASHSGPSPPRGWRSERRWPGRDPFKATLGPAQSVAFRNVHVGLGFGRFLPAGAEPSAPQGPSQKATPSLPPVPSDPFSEGAPRGAKTPR